MRDCLTQVRLNPRMGDEGLCMGATSGILHEDGSDEISPEGREA